MDYKDSIVKKAKYKNYITVDISKVLNFQVYHSKSGARYNTTNWQEVEEESFHWGTDDYIYRQGFSGLYGNEAMLNIAIDYLKQKKKVSNEDIQEFFITTIKEDIVRACADSFRDSYILEAFDWVKDRVPKSIDKSLEELNIKEYQILYYSIEDKTLHNELKYNSVTARIYFSNKELTRIKKEDYTNKDLTSDEIIDDLQENFNAYGLNWEHFDYYGTRGDYNNWLSYFKEYNEVEALIDEAKEIYNTVAIQAM